MRTTGIVRRIDELGRIVIPKETRVNLDLSENDSVEIFTEDNNVILKKYEPGCIFCGHARDVKIFRGKCICKSCIKEM